MRTMFTSAASMFAPGKTEINYSLAFCSRMDSEQENTPVPHSRENGNPDYLRLLQVLLDSHFRGNEEVGQNMSFSDRLYDLFSCHHG